MSLNNINFPPAALARLYPKSLVQSQQKKAKPEPASPASAPRYLGNNAKYITIFVEHPDYSFLPDEELAFLTSILNACKLSIADVALINVKGAPEAIPALMDQTEAKDVILFGIEPLAAGLPIHFPHFQLQSYNKRKYISAPALSILEKDKEQKGKFWAGLKNLFGL